MRNGIEDDQNAKLAASKFVEAIYIYIYTYTHTYVGVCWKVK